MKNQININRVAILVVLLLCTSPFAFGQALDDHDLILQTQDILRHNGINIGNTGIRIQNLNDKRSLVINLSGRRTIIVDMVYNTFYNVGGVIQKAKEPIDQIVINASAQYKGTETYYFQALAKHVEQLYNRTISADEFINNCLIIR
jgi:calcineurin-like phosphoesterase